jgi:hypothetical protein
MCTQNQGEKLEIMLGSEMHALSRYTFFVTIFGAVSHMAHTDACAHVCGHTSVAFSSSCIFCLLFALIVLTPFYGRDDGPWSIFYFSVWTKLYCDVAHLSICMEQN